MKGKKVTAILCAGMMAAGMLAGCGGASGTDAAASSGDAVTGGSVQTGSQASGDKYDHQAIENTKDNITITMMVSGVAQGTDFETQTLPELVHKKWPNVTLEVTKLPDDNYYTSLKTKLASGECPDMILTQPMYAGSNSCYALADAGYLASLNDLDYLSNMPDLSAVTYDGNVVTATTGVSILGTYYNKDLFQKAGISE